VCWTGQIYWLIGSCLNEGRQWHSEILTFSWKHFTVRKTNPKAPFISGLHCSKKTLCFVPIACECMPANYGASTHSLISASELPTATQITLCITSQGMKVFAHIKVPISSVHLMPWCTVVGKWHAIGTFRSVYFATPTT